ncbi:nuclease-related domain-containing protein [Fibrobacter succinogenes]|uniref:Nuclease-related domain-containing protein n=1 Tax=Fibrobacter succinogenes TaxID=833 RepID=A0A380RVN7_FIBSU|nr:nuclease-related domain-containing protein [Fibrobacter succinogenes]PWJ37227.1 nuclease-like protein [Fibrobacter succinogenes subsp. elongatus]SUQ19474.1 Nuclease-related domain-containing protein [Fibrobacter succinogenes]
MNDNMTLEQARKTFWLKNNYRPMGELFDNGFLTVGRLKWGAKKAYESAIRKASVVLLTQKQKMPETIIEKGVIPKNLDEARSVIWPFSKKIGKNGRTMGELVDNRDITKKDLAYALEEAWDEQVRSAARIILSSMLGLENGKVSETKGALKVTANRSFMEQQIEKISFKQGALVGGVLAFCFILLLADFIYMGVTGALYSIFDFILKTKIIGVAFLVIVVMLSVLLGNFLIKHTAEKKYDKLDIQLKNHKLGREGEEKSIDVMRESLDGSCHVFRNLILPNKKEDMDIVLVAPYGVFVFEVKNYNGKYKNIGDSWFYSKKEKWVAFKDNPTAQAKRNACNLAEYLESDFTRNKCKKWVTPIIVLSNADSNCDEENPSVPIWRIQYLAEELGNMPEKRTISEQLQKEICQKLEDLYKKDNLQSTI